MNIEIQNYSLSDLVKRSARQIRFLRLKAQEDGFIPPPTPEQIYGNMVAEQKSTSLYKEMRGTYVRKDITINYCFDEVHVDSKRIETIEHKSIEANSEVAPWYFEQSILQTAVYAAFMQHNKYKKLETPKFYQKQGNPVMELSYNGFNLTHRLLFGDKFYIIESINAKPLVKFYRKKAKATRDKTDAALWDVLYKHKEFEILKEHFSYREE